MQQYLINQNQIFENNIKIDDSDLHHIYKVMRMQVNDYIECVVKETHQRFLVQIKNMNGCFEIVEEILIDNDLNQNIILAYGLVKSDKFEFVIQKAAELGVTTFIPLKMQRSIVKIEENKLDKKKERWQKISKEACEQAKRNSLMEVSAPISVEELTKYQSGLKIVAYEMADQSVKLTDINYQNQDILLVIGPEGGISDEEMSLLKANDFICVSLGKRILRTETAAIFALSVMVSQLDKEVNNEKICDD